MTLKRLIFSTGIAICLRVPQIVVGQVGFAPSSDFPAYAQLFTVTTADLNRDDKVDLIGVSSSGLIVFTNNGIGGFRSNATYAIGARSVLACDINGDGTTDLIIGTQGFGLGPASILVHTNDGGGRLVFSYSLNSGRRFISLAAVDVNGDGATDVIAADAVSPAGSLFVLTNNGMGNITVAGNYTAGNDPFAVVTADLNSDGWPDLVCANYSGNNLSILTNNRSGGFALASSPAVGNLPIHLATADVNGDGYFDLISANSGGGPSGNSLSVLTNNGIGGFATSATYAVGTNPCAVATADVNRDGSRDLISANFVSNTFSVLTNDGAGNFSLAVTCPLRSNANPRGAVVTDVNGDGQFDLISANFGLGSLSVLINAPRLTIKNSSNLPVVSWPSAWTNWTLLQATDSTSTNWSAVAGIADDGTNNSFTVASPLQGQFFRLSYP